MLATAMLLLVLLLLLLYLDCRKPKGYPPGPRWWPILGCLIEIGRIRRKTKYVSNICSELRKKYGPIVGLKIGMDRIVILNDLDDIRTMLSDESCEGRPTGPMYEIRTFGTRQGILLVDGRLWMEQRRFVLRHLRDFGFGRDTMDTIIKYEAEKLVEHFRKMLLNSCQATSVQNPAVNVSQIYKSHKNTDDLKKSRLRAEFNGLENNTVNKKLSRCKALTAASLYVKAEDYEEVRKVSHSAGMIVSMHDAFGVTVLNGLWRLIAGKRFETNDRKLIHLQRIFTKLLENLDMIGAPFSHFPFLRFIAPETSGYKTFLETHQELWEFLREELNNHKNMFVPNEPRDLIDVYLAVLYSKDCGDTFSESQLLAICIDLFVAGSETTSKSLAFAFLYLTLYPEVQRKAQEEIDRVIGRDRFPTLADRANMPYCQAVVLESIRSFVGRSLAIPRRTIKDATIKGYKVPKGTMLVLSFKEILRDESWGDPETFRPERFLDDRGNITIPASYLPFGIGRRRCMGETLAKNNIFLIIIALLQAFNFSVVPGEPRPSKEYVDGATPAPAPYRALVTPRM